MARADDLHRCRTCGAISHRWLGRCAGCGAWNSLDPVAPVPGASAAGRRPGSAGARFAGATAKGRDDPTAARPVPLASVSAGAGRPCPTGIPELDRVLAGGLLPGSVTLVFGEPGVGKSTLLLQVLQAVAGRSRPALLVSAEESLSQVRLRADRIAGAHAEHLLVTATGDLDEIELAVESARPEVMVVDSVQTISAAELAGTPGSPGQVRGCVARLSQMARTWGVATVLVGHVTKDGDVAGPRSLEHLVDTVLAVEGDRHHSLRVLRALKHRFGPTGEIGLFEVGERGLRGVEEPGALLLADRRPEVPGGAVAPLLQGRRPLLVELQALVCAGPGGSARHAAGVEPRRLALLLAVLECRCGIALGGTEIFVSATGGVRADEPGADLPVALAVASAAAGAALPEDLVAFGEVGLGGEIRAVPGADRRLQEAARFGFGRALVPAAVPVAQWPIEIVRVRTVTEAIVAARQMRDRPCRPRPEHRDAVAPAPESLTTGTISAWPSAATSS